MKKKNRLNDCNQNKQVLVWGINSFVLINAMHFDSIVRWYKAFWCFIFWLCLQFIILLLDLWCITSCVMMSIIIIVTSIVRLIINHVKMFRSQFSCYPSVLSYNSIQLFCLFPYSSLFAWILLDVPSCFLFYHRDNIPVQAIPLTCTHMAVLVAAVGSDYDFFHSWLPW